MKVEFARRARLDLIEIGDYLESSAGRRTARRWVERLEARAMSLTSQPHAGAEIPGLAGRRRLVVRPYVIVYRILNADLVRVARVLHGARDLPGLFAIGDED